MSFEDYETALVLAKKYSVKSLLMAAVSKSSSEMLRKINAVFPDIFAEWVSRSNSRDGKLATDGQPSSVE